MHKPLMSLPVAAALGFVSAMAAAQTETHAYPECNRQPTTSEVEGAKGAFQAGQASFKEGDYERTIMYWEDAYRRDCTAHKMLLNLSQAYELADRKEQAVVALETYIHLVPNATDGAQITRRIEVLRQKIDAEKQPPEQAPPPVPAATSPPPPQPAPPPPSPKPEPPPARRPITPLFVVGGGVVVFLVGGVVYLQATDAVDDFENECGGDRQNCPPGFDTDEANSARTRATISGIASLAGAAAIGGGLVWYFMSPRQQQTAKLERKVRFSPAVGQGYTGLQVSGVF